eukprot:711136-Pelagomonas_calceolata.AAC.10
MVEGQSVRKTSKRWNHIPSFKDTETGAQDDWQLGCKQYFSVVALYGGLDVRKDIVFDQHAILFNYLCVASKALCVFVCMRGMWSTWSAVA